MSVAAVNCTADDGATVTAIGTSPTTVPFGTVSLNTFYIGCQDLVVSTNAGAGYSLTAQESAVMQTANGLSTIPDTTCDVYIEGGGGFPLALWCRWCSLLSFST